MRLPADFLFCTGNGLIQKPGKQAQNHNGCHEHCHGEGLGGIGDQVAKSRPCGEKFPNDDAYQAEADIDLHIVNEQRKGSGQQDFKENVAAGAAQGADQPDLVIIGLAETAVQSENGAEYSY